MQKLLTDAHFRRRAAARDVRVEPIESVLCHSRGERVPAAYDYLVEWSLWGQQTSNCLRAT